MDEQHIKWFFSVLKKMPAKHHNVGMCHVQQQHLLHVWAYCHSTILSRFNLADSSLCLACGKEIENIYHILLHCSFENAAWNRSKSKLGLPTQLRGWRCWTIVKYF